MYFINSFLVFTSIYKIFINSTQKKEFIMNEIILLAVPLFLFLLSMAAFLPVLCLLDNQLATRTKRAIFKKSVNQINILGIFSWLFLSHALLADYLAHGFAYTYFYQNSITANLFFFGMVGAFATLINFCIMKKFKNTGMYLITSLISLTTACLLFILAWVFLRNIDLVTLNSIKDIFVISSMPSISSQATEIVGLWDQLIFVFYLATSLLMGFVAAKSMLLCWYVIRRNRDDYGRDYYTQIIQTRAQQLVYSGSLFLLLTAAFMWNIPSFSLERFILIFAGNSIFLMTVFSFALPVAVIFWSIIAKNPQPLQKKSLIFSSFLLFILGWISLLTRIWL